MSPRAGANLLYQMTRTAFLARERDSVLGILWHVLNPLAMSLVLFAVFSQVNVFGRIPDYPLYILIGVVHFNFFTRATTQAAHALVRGRGILLNTTVPQEVLVLRSVLLDTITFGIELLLVVGLVAAFGSATLSWSAAAYAGVFAAMLLATTGVSLAIAAIVVFVSDVTNVWSVLTRLLFFLTPIFYAVDVVGQRHAATAIQLNPLTHVVGEARQVLLYGGTPGPAMIAAIGGALLMLLAGWTTFAALRRRIPDAL